MTVVTAMRVDALDLETLVLDPDTNPWIEVDGKPVDWARPSVTFRTSDCDQCGDVLDGVIEAMDTEYGIQRCDQCQVYDGDIEAAQALAALVGGVVYVSVETPE